MTTYTHAADTI